MIRTRHRRVLMSRTVSLAALKRRPRAVDVSGAVGSRSINADHTLTATRAAAVAVAAIIAEQLAQRVRNLEDDTTRMRVASLGFDRISAGTRQPLPAVMFEAIGAEKPELLKPVDSSASLRWPGALNANEHRSRLSRAACWRPAPMRGGVTPPRKEAILA